MADNISNEYNMIKTLQEIGSNFFPNDLSQQRIGMFGFTCEAMARLFGATILDANMRANEYHTITAKKMDTLLYDASILGVDIENTNPAEMVAYIAFNVDQMHREEYANTTDPNPNYKTYHFLIERDTTINIAGYTFMLEWDVLVTAKHNEKEYVYSARYLTEGDEDPHNNDMCSNRTYIKEDTLSELTDKYIQGNLVKAGGTTLFMMKVNLRQMKKKYEYFLVSENDLISLTGLEFSYDDYLSHFNVYYRSNQNNNWEYVKPISIYDSSEYTEKTIQYQIDRDAKVIILNATKFDMPFNSELRVDIFTTKGSNGNITYSGNGSDIISELKSYDGNHIYNGIDIACVPINSAIGGKDVASIEDVRGKVIRAKASKNSLNTEYDLYNYMKEYDLINDYVFIKKRSDILEHIYGTFTILRTDSGDIIPTTTSNIIIKNEADEENGIYKNDNIISIKAGTALRNTTDEDADLNMISQLINNANDEDVNSYKTFLCTTVDRNERTNAELVLDEKNMKLYGLPYTLAYDTVNQLSSLYFTSLNQTLKMSLVPAPKDSDYDTLEYDSNFIIDHMTITRNSFIGEDSYKLKVSLMCNGDYSHCGDDQEDIDNFNKGLHSNALMIKGFIYSKDETELTSDGEEYPFAYFDFNFDSFSDGVFNFSADLKIKDSLIMTDNNIKILSPGFMYVINALNSDNSNPPKVSTNATVPIDAFNLKIGLGIYYLSDEINDESNPSLVFQTNSDGDYKKSSTDKLMVMTNDYGYPEFMKADTPYIMTNLYTNSSNLVDLYTDMSYVIRVITNESTYSDDDNYIYFRDVPLLQYSKAINEKIANRVTTIINDTKVHLDDMNIRLGDSFSLDYKFFRTYGPCQYFKLQTIDSEDEITLGNLDITFEFNARIKPGITATDADITNQLKSFLKTYVEKLNDEDDDYTIYMSNITTELEKNFPDILKSIDLVDINGQGNKYRILLYAKPDVVNYTSQVNGRNMIKNYVPEYLNLPLENITINIIR